MSLGYRFKDFGFGKNITMQANVTNLTDEKYISTIGSNGFGNIGDNQTFLAGAPLQWFVSLRASSDLTDLHSTPAGPIAVRPAWSPPAPPLHEPGKRAQA